MAEVVIDILEPGEPFGYEQLTADGTVKTLTASKYKNTIKSGATARPFTATTALIALSTANIRYTMDGTAPVAGTTGHLLLAGQSRVIRGAGNITKFKFIAESGSPVLDVEYTL